MKTGCLPWLTTPACALVLLGCDRNTGADAYQFQRKELHHAQVTVTRVEHATITDLRKAATARGVKPQTGRALMAFAVVSTSRPVCELHLVDPAVGYAPEWIGHELAHCFYGRWHEGE